MNHGGTEDTEWNDCGRLRVVIPSPLRALSASVVKTPRWGVALLTVALALAGCRKGMVDQPRLKPLAESRFFADGSGARVPPAHTVARGQLRDDDAFHTGLIDGHLVAELPVPLSAELLARGRERFNIYCAVCHGRTGEADGMIVQRGFPKPPTLHETRLREAPIGHFFDVMTNGFGVMYPYAARVTPQDRWAIAAYIRALQLSQHATPEDADAADRKQLATP